MTLAMRMLSNRQDSEEALQDAFIRAFNALPRFEWRSSFSTWFYRIVYNVCATALSKRDEARLVSLDEEKDEQIDLPAEEKSADLEYESSEFRQAVAEEIEKLPETYRSILTLFLVQDLSYEEIVDVTGSPLGTVKVRLFRARMLLRNGVVRRLGREYSALHQHDKIEGA